MRARRRAASQRTQEPQQGGELLLDAAGKAVEQRDRMVRRSIPGTTDRRARRAAVVPCSIAEINVTTVAR